jgi:hypothetical protein
MVRESGLGCFASVHSEPRTPGSRLMAHRTYIPSDALNSQSRSTNPISASVTLLLSGCDCLIALTDRYLQVDSESI